MARHSATPWSWRAAPQGWRQRSTPPWPESYSPSKSCRARSKSARAAPRSRPVVLAGVVAIALVGDFPFGQPQVAAKPPSITPKALLVATLCGLGGGLFSLLDLGECQAAALGPARPREGPPRPVRGALGLGVAALGAASGALTYGTGYDEAGSILENHAHLSWMYAPARAAATWLSYLSRGFPRLARALALGGCRLRSVFRGLSGQSSQSPFAILGMCGFLAVASSTPDLLRHRDGDDRSARHGAAPHACVTAAIATAASRLVSRPLYQSLADRYPIPDPDPGRPTHPPPVPIAPRTT